MEPGRRLAAGGTATRVLGLVVCVALLMVLLALVRGVVDERRNWRDRAVADITGTWGGRQEILGPVLAVPYRYLAAVQKTVAANGVTTVRDVLEPQQATAYFLPEKLTVEGDLEPTVLHRGIYRTPVYRAKLRLKGVFAPPRFDDWKVAPGDVLWDEARLTLALAGLRGVNGAAREYGQQQQFAVG